MKKENFVNYKMIIKTAITCLLVLFAAGSLLAQYKGNPVKKEKLLSVLRSKQLQTREIVAVIKSNGVDFQLTSAAEGELTAAGARAEVLSAIRENYRQPSRSNPVASSKTTTTTTKNFSGQPLAKDAIVTLLENGVADVQVRKNVEARGVSFKPNAQINNEIRQAGGSVALVNLIAASYVDANAGSVGNSDGAGNNTSGGDDYDALVDKAVSQYDVSKDVGGSIVSLQQAIRLEPNNARAYQLLGFTYLYGQKNFAESEKYMREAVTRGGSAVFRVFHDHDGLFSDTCQGSLYIAKDTVRFESDDNVHTFQTDDANIKQVKMNSIFKTFYKAKAGSFKIVLKSGETDSVKYSFAPLTDNALESKMIIRLIGKN